MSDVTQFRFDVFLSHAREDKAQVRALAQQLTAAGLSAWLDEEQLAPGHDPRKAVARGLEESQHVLIWVSDAWLKKAWTQWELDLFATIRGDTRRVLPLLRVPWDDALLGPYLTRQVAISPEHGEHERLWLVFCGIRGATPGERSSWAARGQQLIDGSRVPAAQGATEHPVGSISARLESAYRLREELTIAGEDTAEVATEILELRRSLRHGPALHAGEFLGDGRFRLVEVIGQGGFASVWRAFDRKLHQPVAIKVLHGQFAQVAGRRERLFRGARRMAELQHPHVVRVLVPESEEQGFYYFAMEHIAGGDLYHEVIQGRLGSEQALTVVECIAGVLEVAHKRGLVHRDVKPQNILLREGGAPALTDFDLVQAMDTTGGTRTGAMGTVLYAAPEQNEDASRVDHRADIYSLGMTAVFCIYGKKLPQRAVFQRDAFLAELDCSEAVRAVLQRAVAIQADDRFESISNFREALAAARLITVGAASSKLEADSEGERFIDEMRPEEAGEESNLGPMSPSFSEELEGVDLSSPVSRRKLFGAGGGMVASLVIGAWWWFSGENKPHRVEKGLRNDGKHSPIRGNDDKIELGRSYLTNNATQNEKHAENRQQVIVAPKGGVELVLVRGGYFLMGSPEGIGEIDEHPQRKVKLMSFYLAQTPVTKAQYGKYLEANPEVEKPECWGDWRFDNPEQPVVGVSWIDAKAYCDWAGLTLPTEAQWEYACRAGTTTRYCSGDKEEDLARVGWYDNNSDGRLHAVGKKEPNDFGLYDMHGNIWEWCLDNYDSYTTNPRSKDGLRHEPKSDAYRVLRGGSWLGDADYARSAYRDLWRPGYRYLIVGFRPAQAIS